MTILFVTAFRIEKEEILRCFNSYKVAFTDNSAPDDPNRNNRYAFEGRPSDLMEATKKLDAMSGRGIIWALMEMGARPFLVSTGGNQGTHLYEDAQPILKLYDGLNLKDIRTLLPEPNVARSVRANEHTLQEDGTVMAVVTRGTL